MAQTASTQAPSEGSMWSRRQSPYEQWIETLDLPILRGYFLEDIRTCEVGWWDEQQCGTAIVVMAGQEGTAEVRVTEIPAGKNTAPVKFALDEMVYVADGRGLANVWAEGRPPKTFEWQKHSLFMLPRGYTHSFSNTSGDRPARLLHYNSLPKAMETLPDPNFFFKSNVVDPNLVYGDAGFSEAKEIKTTEEEQRGGAYWIGNFFPDMRSWDSFVPNRGRGAGGSVVWIRYPNSAMWNHMSAFDTQMYKKAHRHGPGTLIVVPEGDGFSYLWPEGSEKIYVPWGEGAVFVPPNRWFHQHFNVGDRPARYLAFHAPGRSTGEYQAPDGSDQIEYWQEDLVIRETFERRLAEKGIKTLMPEQCYTDRNFEWDYGNGD